MNKKLSDWIEHQGMETHDIREQQNDQHRQLRTIAKDAKSAVATSVGVSTVDQQLLHDTDFITEFDRQKNGRG